jgi:hypothetical protein
MDGNCIDTPCRLHSYEGPERNFPVMEPILIDHRLMHVGTIGMCTVKVIDAMGLIESALHQLCSDPYFLCARPRP